MSHAEESDFAVVIPVCNEAATIRSVAEQALRHSARVIVVDDGSSDASSAELEGLPLTLLRNASNRGKAASLWRGMEHALAQGVDAVITLDGDGQHDPRDIVRLVSAWRHSPGKIVIGARLADRRKIPVLRYVANRFASFLIAWAAGYPIEDSQSGFRLYPASVLRSVTVRHDERAGFVFESEILIEAGRLGIISIAVPIAAVYPRGARRSHFRPVLDSLRIGRMLAWKLLSRGFCLPGLFKSFSMRAEVGHEAHADQLYKS